jgi:AAA+ ATPase superfamily predicted ATPase
MLRFVGRKYELKLLEDLFKQGDARAITIKGRRRVGKSALVKEFAKDKCFLTLTGEIPSERTTEQGEKNHFFENMCKQLDIPFTPHGEWRHIFWDISKGLDKNKDAPTVLFLDEVSWISTKDPSFIPALKVWWDTDLCDRSNFMLIFCGSISTWIQKNIIMSTAFYGRLSLRLTLEPLSLSACVKLLRERGFKGDKLEIFRILCLTGGVPFYLEQIEPNLLAKDNMKKLCFTKNGPLVDEFDMIFHDLFNGDAVVHKKILEILSNGIQPFSSIKKEFGDIDDKELLDFLDNLYVCGFVMEYGQQSFKTRENLKEAIYGLCDPYVHFYLKYIEPRRANIKKKVQKDPMEMNIPGFDGIIGLVMETLLIQNNDLIMKAIGINPPLGCFIGPYYQKKTPKQKACQIDFLIHENENLFVCEFKFSSAPLGMNVIDQMKEKISRLVVPPETNIIPVLFHVGGVSKEVVNSLYFYRIIDISVFLDAED